MKDYKKLAIENAIDALEGAKGELYDAANELLIEWPADAVAPQLDSLAKQTQQAIDTLKDRLKRVSLVS